MEPVEAKLFVTTGSADGHTHTVRFPEGDVGPGTWTTSEADGHTHEVNVAGEIEVGETARTNTSETNGHSHSVSITPIPEGEGDGDGMDEETDASKTCKPGSPDYPACRNKDDGRPVERAILVIERVEEKQIIVDGIPMGVVEGYIATWDPDRGGRFGVPDRFEPGAFADSIAEHRARGNRQVRLKDHHGRTIGGFPIQTIREDSVGLFGTGNINLEVQQGREAYSLARQRVLTDFSVGFITLADRMEDGIRVIEKAILLEGSVVDEPANPAAQILEVRNLQFENLDDAKAAAEAIIRLPDQDADKKAAAILQLERQFAKFGEPSPFAPEDRQFYGAVDVKDIGRRELETALIACGKFSKKAAKLLASMLTVGSAESATQPVAEPKAVPYDPETAQRIIKILGELKESLTAG